MIDEIWFGDSSVARAARAALYPAERVFAAASGLRTLMYDAGWLRRIEPPIPVVSVGNLTVGGTGKTPIAAWIAAWLRDHGAAPAVVLRGYGDDEPDVHRALNPTVDVVVDADRVRGVRTAADHARDVAVLDDAFQHRRLGRTADIALISADAWTGDARLLPAGPWREPLSAAGRADLVIVTRKAAAPATVDAVHAAIASAAPRVPRVSVHLAPGELRRVGGVESKALESLRGVRVLLTAGIADPTAFVRQLEAVGARVDPILFPDHHAFDASDVRRIVAAAGGALVVCTLKDAVKLEKSWPREAPSLWYVSQRVMVERGVGGIEQLLASVLDARHAHQTNDQHGSV